MTSVGHAEHRSPNSVCYELTKKQNVYATAGRAIARCQLLGVGTEVHPRTLVTKHLEHTHDTEVRDYP